MEPWPTHAGGRLSAGEVWLDTKAWSGETSKRNRSGWDTLGCTWTSELQVLAAELGSPARCSRLKAAEEAVAGSSHGWLQGEPQLGKRRMDGRRQESP